MVFRYGGDEFTFILPGTDEAGALKVADRARLAVAATGDVVNASVGVASFPQDGVHGDGHPPRRRPGLLRRQAERP